MEHGSPKARACLFLFCIAKTLINKSFDISLFYSLHRGYGWSWANT
jgi:hypothetical protein